MLKSSLIFISLRGTSRTLPSARPPSPRFGLRTPPATKRHADMPRSPNTPPRPLATAPGASVSAYRAAPTARLHGDVVTFRWEMLLADSETVLAGGLEFLIVDDDGRILADHPFAAA
jgi:hypothetical protein